MLTFTRIWLPAGLALGGLVLAIIGHGKTALAAAGVCFILIGLSVWLLNWMFRLSVQSNKERDEEEAARDYYEAHGRWPDE